MIGDGFVVGTYQPSWLARLESLLFVGSRTLWRLSVTPC
jgi:hypothetical protein